MKLFHLLGSVLSLFLGLLISYWGWTTTTGGWLFVPYVLVSGYCFYLAYLAFKNRYKTKVDRMNDWGKEREKGVAYFILFKGIVGWGLPVGFVNWTLTDQTLIAAIINIFVYAIGGAFMGWFFWSNMERDFEKHMSQ